MAGETRQQIRAEERSREKIRRKSFSPTPPAPASPAPSGKGWLPKASLSDSLGMLAFPLAAVGMLIDNMVAVGVLLFLATVIPCVAIAQHSEIKKIDRLIAGLVCGAVFFSLFFVLKSEHDKRELAKNEGLLVPSNLPRPETRCSIPENNFAIYSGGGVTYGPTRPAALLTMGGQEIISADGLDNGAIRLRTSRLYDDQNEIIARVTNNELWVHPLARRERPDFGTLIRAYPVDAYTH
jgi:hypothetical protein